MNNFVVLVDYVTMLSFLREDNKAMQGEAGDYEREGRGQEARMEELVEKNEEKSKIIECLSTQKAELENKIQRNEKIVEKQKQMQNRKNKNARMRQKIRKLQNRSDNEKSDLKLPKPKPGNIPWPKQESDQSDTVKNEMEIENLKAELIRSKAEKDELKRILSEKEELIISQNQTLKRKNQNLKDLLNEIHKSCTNS